MIYVGESNNCQKHPKICVNLKGLLCYCLIAVMIPAAPAASHNPEGRDRHLWQPVRDSVYPG